jgi:hypothetical protein
MRRRLLRSRGRPRAALLGLTICATPTAIPPNMTAPLMMLRLGDDYQKDYTSHVTGINVMPVTVESMAK